MKSGVFNPNIVSMTTLKAPAADMTLNTGKGTWCTSISFSVSICTASGREISRKCQNARPRTSAEEDANLAQAYMLDLAASIGSNTYLRGENG